MFVAECDQNPGILDAYIDPSMGPQHVRCGMYNGRMRRLIFQKPFNGAATCSLRNVPFPTRLFFNHVSFNGAATCSLRNAGRSATGCSMMPCLQWGRNMFVAEWSELTQIIHGLTVPSMGPQHVRCGMESIASQCSKNHVLQWGRNMFVAESSSASSILLTLVSLQWGRNMFVAECMHGIMAKFAMCVLQWGRNMFVAECRLVSDGAAAGAAPSMGPQHVRCGMRKMLSNWHGMDIPSMGPQHVRCGMLSKMRGPD